MAEDKDITHHPISGEGMHAADDALQADRMARAAGAVGARGDFPDLEAGYWREAYSSEPYYEAGRTYDEYAPAYELGWFSYIAYGGEFEAADRVMANDWDLRKGGSSLPWDDARPATRAAWNRAHNQRNFVSDGSASRDQVLETLNDLLENSRDGELGFREAAEHTKTPKLAALFARRAQACGKAAAELEEHIQRLGGKPDEGGTVTGAAHRVWLHIRGLFGGASDETMLNECERGEDAAVARYRKALKQNLPQDVHDMVLRQYEGAQRNHDEIKRLRDRARAQTQTQSESQSQSQSQSQSDDAS